MQAFIIAKNDAGQRLDKFLTKAVPLLPKSLLYKYIRLKRIKVNGKRAQISTRLSEGDELTLYINDEFFAPKAPVYEFLYAGKQLEIVYEDKNLMLLNKTPGLLCHPDDREFRDTLIGRVHRYLYEKGEYQPEAELSFTPALVNRIDRNTGGIVIAAKTAEALRFLNEKMKARELQKYYLCIVHGKVSPESALLEGFLVKDEAKNKVRILNHPAPNAKTVKTQYHVLGIKNGLSLLDVHLLTGRTHQIRAHMASIGHPLLGDGKYGTNALNKQYGYKKQALYAYKLKFEFSGDAGVFTYLQGKTFQAKSVWFEEAFWNNSL